MMQFLWRYVDELIGKGLSMMVLAKFLFYSGETLVPLALPLAILLASLISFGNMGERLELLSLKAAGIPLTRILRPLIVVNILLAGASFYFQDNIAPKSEIKLRQLLYSVRTASAELAIPEGVFYDGVPGVNLYVRHKDKETGMLYDLIIYNLQDGPNNAHIILADSGKLLTSYDKTMQLLHLYNGEQFENMSDASLQTRNVPYRRETFVQKDVIIDYDMNFKLEDEENFKDNEGAKNIEHILISVDSLHQYYDSLGREFYTDMKCGQMYIGNSTMAMRRNYETGTVEDLTPKDLKRYENDTLHIDSVFQRMDLSAKQRALFAAQQRVMATNSDLMYKSEVMSYGDQKIRRHWISFWQKFTMSLSCILFFFIGAPLGAIIRKGGLGTPVVIAVIVFIFYYIINNSGMKVGREGSIPVWFGMWISSFIMIPLGIFLTIKSNNDSVVFNKDAYTSFFRRLFGIRLKRHITKKEVIIDDPDYPMAAAALESIMRECHLEVEANHGRYNPLKYLWYIVKRPDESHARMISENLEVLIDALSNSKDKHVLLTLNGFPILDPDSFRFYRRRKGDMKAILKYGDLLLLRIEEMTGTTRHVLPDHIAQAVIAGENIIDETEQ